MADPRTTVNSKPSITREECMVKYKLEVQLKMNGVQGEVIVFALVTNF